MSKPVILAIDDDQQVLAAVSRDLRARYAEDYRVLRAQSGSEGLMLLEELKGRGDQVAVFVVDQRMPQMTGTEFLLEARAVYPDTKRVLLTAYADTKAAISAINDVGLDHYLLKPWDPPDQHLYPILDDLIDDWRANVPAPFDGIRVAGTRWSPLTHTVKDFLSRNQIPYRFYDVETDPDTKAMVEAATDGAGTLPVVFLPDGTNVIRPDPMTLAGLVGLQVEAKEPFYDVVIVGAGPAGLGAAVYAASEGLRTAVIEKEATGGQAGTSSRIENYLGFPQGISGVDLARRASTQARKFGAEIITAVGVSSISGDETGKLVALDNGAELRARAVIVATGMTIRELPVPDHHRLIGAGIYYGAAPSEAVLYRGEPVFVVGGANSAGQAAMMLSRYAGTVTVLVRGESLEAGMSQYLVDQIRATDNIAVKLGVNVSGVSGEDHLEGLTLQGADSEETVEADGLFIFIGARPHSDFVKGLVARDKRGFILTGPEVAMPGVEPAWPLERDPFLLETSAPGIFAAGDVRAEAVRRVASAVGQGAVCVSFVHRYLETV